MPAIYKNPNIIPIFIKDRILQYRPAYQAGPGNELSYLLPYAIPLIFDLPAHTLSDQAADAGTLLGSEGRVLEQKIYEAADHRLRAKLISQFIGLRP